MAVALVVLVVLAVPGAGAAAGAAGDPEAALAARVTAERAASGLGPLAVDADLVAVARAHSATMASQARLFHTPDLATQVQGWVKLAENVGVGTTVDDVDRALMASADHRADILDPRFNGIGIGVVAGGGRLWVTQVFRQRQGAPAPTAAPSPPPAPAPAAPPAAPAPRRAPVVRAAPVRLTTTTTTAPPTTATTATVPPTTAPAEARVLAPLAAAASAPLPSRPPTGPAALVALALLVAVGSATAAAAARGR